MGEKSNMTSPLCTLSLSPDYRLYRNAELTFFFFFFLLPVEPSQRRDIIQMEYKLEWKQCNHKCNHCSKSQL